MQKKTCLLRLAKRVERGWVEGGKYSVEGGNYSVDGGNYSVMITTGS